MTVHFDEKKLGATPLVAPETPDKDSFYAAHAKRFVDLFLVLLAAPIVVPVVAVLAALVSLDGSAPLYRQRRVGRGGKAFSILKLRTMVPNAEVRLEAYLAAHPEARAEWDATQKLKHDPRITRIGSILRKTSMDELPQLWNILKGDMSIVGPRPMLQCQRRMYPGTAYFRMRPGLTGYWQISDRNDAEFVRRAHYDTRYYSERSLFVDIAVILRTVAVVLRGTGY